jgi:hypothetical protein
MSHLPLALSGTHNKPCRRQMPASPPAADPKTAFPEARSGRHEMDLEWVNSAPSWAVAVASFRATTSIGLGMGVACLDCAADGESGVARGFRSFTVKSGQPFVSSPTFFARRAPSNERRQQKKRLELLMKSPCKLADLFGVFLWRCHAQAANPCRASICQVEDQPISTLGPQALDHRVSDEGFVGWSSRVRFSRCSRCVFTQHRNSILPAVSRKSIKNIIPLRLVNAGIWGLIGFSQTFQEK